MRVYWYGITGSLLFFLVIQSGFAQTKYTLNINGDTAIHEFFTYTCKDIPLISGHRGTLIKGYPENSIEAFEYVLQHTPAFFEIDPRLTKDSIIVLMHDETLDRTTTGRGKVSGYTWQELQQLYLKDVEGNITPYKIPTLPATIKWARGKTILNLDKKNVPFSMTAKIIREMNAAGFVMVTVHNAEEAAYYYNANKNQMMSAFIKTPEEMQSYEKLGIPWKNMIAYIGSKNIPENKLMLDLLHEQKVMCMISAAPIYDKLPTPEQRGAAYRAIYDSGADILESDIPVEVGRIVEIPKSSAKLKFFTGVK